MQIILSLGNYRTYIKLYSDRRPRLTFTCKNEQCNGRTLHKHGFYCRMPVFKHQQVTIPIYRWCCPLCGKTVAVLPDFLVPGAHFATSVREASIRRRVRGDSFAAISRDIVSNAVGGVSIDTIKRWWKRHLQNIAAVTQWTAGELVKSGIEDNLLRLHFKGINPTVLDTVSWLDTLLARLFKNQKLPPGGCFGILNARMPQGMWL